MLGLGFCSMLSSTNKIGQLGKREGASLGIDHTESEEGGADGLAARAGKERLSVTRREEDLAACIGKGVGDEAGRTRWGRASATRKTGRTSWTGCRFEVGDEEGVLACARKASVTKREWPRALRRRL